MSQGDKHALLVVCFWTGYASSCNRNLQSIPIHPNPSQSIPIHPNTSSIFKQHLDSKTNSREGTSPYPSSGPRTPCRWTGAKGQNAQGLLRHGGEGGRPEGGRGESGGLKNHQESYGVGCVLRPIQGPWSSWAPLSSKFGTPSCDCWQVFCFRFFFATGVTCEPG